MILGGALNLREPQHTPGAYPMNPQTPKWKESLHKLLVGGLGYVPGVCWKILRLKHVFCFYSELEHLQNITLFTLDDEEQSTRVFQKNHSPIIWVFPKIGVGTPKSSILIGFSLINHPFWGTTIFGNTHIIYRIWCCFNKLNWSTPWKSPVRTTGYQSGFLS